MSRWGAAAAILIAVLAAGPPAGAQYGSRFVSVRIRLTVIPESVAADGRTSATVRADLRNSDNSPVPDGTEVVIYTNLGELTTDGVQRDRQIRVSTTGGVATAEITSIQPGQATIQAQVQDGGRAEALVEFRPEGVAAEEGANVVFVRGKWVGYNPESERVEALSAELKYRGLTILADQLWLDTNRLIVKADLPRIKRGERSLSGETAYYDLVRKRGVLRRFDDIGQVQEVFFRGLALEITEKPNWTPPEDAFREPQEEPSTWMVCRAVTVFPDEKVVLRSATLYVGEQRVTKLPPLFVLGKQGYRGSTNNQVIDVSSTGGIAVDFPYFLSVTDTSSTSVHVQKGRRYGRLGVREGWSLALEREYDTPHANGSIALDSLPYADVGLHWAHEQQIGRGVHGAFDVAWPGHRNLFTSASVIQRLNSGRLYYRFGGDKTAGSGFNLDTSVDYLNRPVRLGRTGLSLRPGTRLQYRHRSYYDLAPFSQTLSADLSLRPWRPDKVSSIRPLLSYQFTWDSDLDIEHYWRFALGMDRRFKGGRRVSLDYAITQRSGSRSPYSRGIRQRLDASYVSFGSRRLRTMLNASYDITENNWFALGSMDYRFAPKWHVQLLGRYFTYRFGSFSDAEVSIGRAIGNREIALRWSAEENRLALELGGGFY